MEESYFPQITCLIFTLDSQGRGWVGLGSPLSMVELGRHPQIVTQSNFIKINNYVSH